jgi:virulence factor Mce-like protein
MRRQNVDSGPGVPRRIAFVVALCLVAAVVAATVLYRLDRPERRLVAHFTGTVGVHNGSDVRVMGVRIGEVLTVTPEGRTVRVEMRYDASFDLPADAQALVVAPSVVSDRYIQLTPAYTVGAVLPDGADLPVDRTAVPIELDEVYRSLDELNRALGPSGANADGALADLVATARKNLEGNGDQLHDTLDGLSQALSTVADGRDDLFGTVANLADFTAALAHSDAQVREFNQRLAAVGEQLAAERDDLAAALRALGTALGDVAAFVRENRDALVSNVGALADITGVLVRQQKALMDVLDVAPLTLSNLGLAYNGRSGTLDTRDNILGPYDPASYVCSLMVNVVPAGQIPQACFDLAKALSSRHLPLTNDLRTLLGLAPVATPALPTPGPVGTVPGVVEVPDLTLGGILRGGR